MLYVSGSRPQVRNPKNIKLETDTGGAELSTSPSHKEKKGFVPQSKQVPWGP